MHPDKVRREQVSQLTDLPNIGPSLAGDLRQLGIARPQQLQDAEAYRLYRRLCDITQTRQDPCVLDVFLSITDFMAGNPPRVWWHYTAERKRRWPSL
ncbi:MAG: helix-hairpin-helix domain-containing protein [Arenimonas sp.]